MNKDILRKKISVALLISFISISLSLSGKTQSQGPGVFNPTLASTSPKIDGSLDDEIWKKSPLTEDFITYNPAYGEVFPQKTEVWMAYDKKNLYIS